MTVIKIDRKETATFSNGSTERNKESCFGRSGECLVRKIRDDTGDGKGRRNWTRRDIIVNHGGVIVDRERARNIRGFFGRRPLEVNWKTGGEAQGGDGGVL